jgi:hypothetical protein
MMMGVSSFSGFVQMVRFRIESCSLGSSFSRGWWGREATDRVDKSLESEPCSGTLTPKVHMPSRQLNLYSNRKTHVPSFQPHPHFYSRRIPFHVHYKSTSCKVLLRCVTIPNISEMFNKEFCLIPMFYVTAVHIPRIRFNKVVFKV